MIADLLREPTDKPTTLPPGYAEGREMDGWITVLDVHGLPVAVPPLPRPPRRRFLFWSWETDAATPLSQDELNLYRWHMKEQRTGYLPLGRPVYGDGLTYSGETDEEQRTRHVRYVLWLYRERANEEPRREWWEQP